MKKSFTLASIAVYHAVMSTASDAHFGGERREFAGLVPRNADVRVADDSTNICTRPPLRAPFIGFGAIALEPPHAGPISSRESTLVHKMPPRRRAARSISGLHFADRIDREERR